MPDHGAPTDWPLIGPWITTRSRARAVRFDRFFCVSCFAGRLPWTFASAAAERARRETATTSRRMRESMLRSIDSVIQFPAALGEQVTDRLEVLLRVLGEV